MTSRRRNSSKNNLFSSNTTTEITTPTLRASTHTTTSTSCSFSYTTQQHAHDIATTPVNDKTPSPLSSSAFAKDSIGVPVTIFSQHSSAMQALCRYLVDQQGMNFTQVAMLLQRSPKSVWASYHQTTPLIAVRDESLRIPISIFTTTKAPLEALVTHLKSLGLRNVEIARTLGLDPRTIWTVARRAEVKP